MFNFWRKEEKEENSERTLGKKNAAVDFRNQSKVRVRLTFINIKL